MRPSVQPFLWKWVLFAWEWNIISISKAEDLTSFWYRGLGNSEMAYLGTLPSDRGGDTCRLFWVVNCRFLGLYQVGCVPDESLRTKGIKKAEEERWKEKRAKHSVAASLPELKLLQLSCAGCLWSFKAWVSPRLLFFWGLSEFTLFFRLTFPPLLHQRPPSPLLGISKEYALRQI